MKTLAIILLLLLTNQLSANELAWVDEQVKAIQPPRIGISEKRIEQLKDPFIFLIKQEETIGSKSKKTMKRAIHHPRYVKKYHSKKLHLDAVLNKSALINHHWYKEGQYLYGYKLVKVQHSSVLLQKRNKTLLLSTESRSKNLKFHNK
jgi:hypothetical protein